MSAPIFDGNPSILLVETDENFATQIRHDLKEAGYSTIVAADLKYGWQQFQQRQPSMVVVDRTRIGEPGLHFCRQIRDAGSHTPVLLLMARETLDDRVACLDSGADDYLVKPYRPESLLQLVGLYIKPAAGGAEQLRFGDLTLDLSTRRAIRSSREIDLTMKEFELLKFLMSHPGEVMSREQILENVWGYDYMGESNVIEVYIRYLRLKMEDEGEKRLIQTVRGVGYVLREA